MGGSGSDIIRGLMCAHVHPLCRALPTCSPATITSPRTLYSRRFCAWPAGSAGRRRR